MTSQTDNLGPCEVVLETVTLVCDLPELRPGLFIWVITLYACGMLKKAILFYYKCPISYVLGNGYVKSAVISLPGNIMNVWTVIQRLSPHP